MKEVLVFISDNFSDWEVAFISAELNKPETDYIVKTLAIVDEPIKSMGGLTVIPNYTLDTMPKNFELLILAGGLSWLKGLNNRLEPVIDLCIEKKTTVAAICDACTFLANNSYLDNIGHTGNTKEYLTRFAPNYKGQEFFIEKQVVSADTFITANGTSAIEFAKEIMKKLNVMPEEDLEKWYKMFKVGFYKN